MKRHPYARYAALGLAKILAEQHGRPKPSDEDTRLAEAIVDQGWSPYPPEISRDRIAQEAQYMLGLMRQRERPFSPEDALAIALRHMGIWVQGGARDI